MSTMESDLSVACVKKHAGSNKNMANPSPKSCKRDFTAKRIELELNQITSAGGKRAEVYTTILLTRCFLMLLGCLHF